MKEVLVNCLFKLAQEKVLLGLTDHPAMTIAVDLGRKATKQTKQTNISITKQRLRVDPDLGLLCLQKR